MSKKNLTEKKLRRELEVLRAQMKSGYTTSEHAIANVLSTAKEVASPIIKNQKVEKHELPIYLIKKDLIKTVLFACFAIGILFVINVSKVSL
jgi:hypothetical protein